MNVVASYIEARDGVHSPPLNVNWETFKFVMFAARAKRVLEFFALTPAVVVQLPASPPAREA